MADGPDTRSRVWTRQELWYCRTVRVAYATPKEMGCAWHPSIETSATRARAGDLSNLSTFADRLYTKFLLRGYPPSDAYRKIISANAAFFDNALQSLSHFRGPSAQERQPNMLWDGFLKAADFLSGQKLRREAGGKSELDEFLFNLGMLGESTRKTTEAYSFVASA